MNEPELYEIQVQGALADSWEAWFAGMTLSCDGPLTILTGYLDQAALHGVLLKIGSLGLKLLSVRRMEEEC